MKGQVSSRSSSPPAANHPTLASDAVASIGGLEHVPPASGADAIEQSGKMVFIAALLAALRKERERVVIVSNFTETLNWLSMYCKLIHYPTIQFDSSVCVDSKTQMVECFNNPDCYEFAFLLSSKAGGCGQNLVGGASLIMVDPDWNPANDEQAMGRVWRDGQKKKCHIYRTLSAGTIEEKMFQRQIKKLGIAREVAETLVA